jgi:hypothetical protein
MKLIPLTQGKFTQVDDKNYDYLMQWKWYARKCGKAYYAARKEWIKDRKYCATVYMHRVIMNTLEGQEVDHIDHNGLNNLEENMRNCIHTQNTFNSTPFGKSQYKGVWIKRGRFHVDIGPNGSKIRLGPFSTEEEAARAYDKVAKELYGEFANLNFK